MIMVSPVGAFVFVQTKLGKAFDVAKSVRHVEGVMWTCAVTGVLDLIV